jgi:hypothetical protein
MGDVYLHGNKLYVRLDNVTSASTSKKRKPRSSQPYEEQWKEEEELVRRTLLDYVDSIRDDSEREKVLSALKAASLKVLNPAEPRGSEGPICFDASSMPTRAIRSFAEFRRERDAYKVGEGLSSEEEIYKDDALFLNNSFDDVVGGEEFKEMDEAHVTDSGSKGELSDSLSSIHDQEIHPSSPILDSQSLFPTADIQPSSLTADIQPSSLTADIQPSSLTADIQSSFPTADIQLSSLTADIQPSSSTADIQPSDPTQDVQPLASTLKDSSIIFEKGDSGKDFADMSPDCRIANDPFTVKTESEAKNQSSISPFARLKAAWKDACEGVDSLDVTHHGTTPSVSPGSGDKQTVQKLEEFPVNCQQLPQSPAPGKEETKKTSTKRAGRRGVRLAASFGGPKPLQQRTDLQVPSPVITVATSAAGPACTHKEPQESCSPLSKEPKSDGSCEREIGLALPVPLYSPEQLSVRKADSLGSSEDSELNDSGQNLGKLHCQITALKSNLKEIKSYNEDLSKQSSKPSIASTEGESDDSLDRALAHASFLQLSVIHCQDETKTGEKVWQEVFDNWLTGVTFESHVFQEMQLLKDLQTSKSRMKEERLKQELLQSFT